MNPLPIIEANIAGTGFCRIAVADGVISAVERLDDESADVPYCSPGFVDLQINGFAGIDFSDPELDVGKIARVLPPIWATGVTSFCPTLITNSLERLERNFTVLETARHALPGFAASAPCYHLEGPWLSPGPSRGAHDPAHMRKPEWDDFQRLQAAAGGNIGILTIAPEWPGATEFVRRVSATGVIVALSHTDGGPDDVHAAAAAGATMSTHLGNGCPQLLDRHRAPFFAQLADQRLHAGLICDGFHLATEMVQIIQRAKGLERCFLVTDAVHVATLPPGRYSLVGTEIDLLPTGQVVRADRGSMAGSALGMDAAISNFMRMTGLPLVDALRGATLNPARLLARPSVCSRIAAGESANLTLFRVNEGRLSIERTLVNGHVSFRAGSTGSNVEKP